MRRLNKTINYDLRLQRTRVEFINLHHKRAKCHVGTFCISKISQLSIKTDTDWPFPLIAQGLDVRLARMVSVAVVKMCRCFHTCWMTRFNNNYASD